MKTQEFTKMKTVKSEIKKNIQGTNSDGKETETQINDLEQKEETNIQLEQKKEMNSQPNRKMKQKFKKMRRGLGTSGITLNVPTSD